MTGATKALRVAWSGHRPAYFAGPAAVEQRIHEIARSLRRVHGDRLRFETGGQLGVDVWAAEAARELGVPYSVCLPLPAEAFTAGWTDAARQRLHRLIEAAADLWIAPPCLDPYGARNQRLVDASDRLEVCWSGLHSGGTWDTIQRARRAGRRIRFHRFAWSGTTPPPSARGA